MSTDTITTDELPVCLVIQSEVVSNNLTEKMPPIREWLASINREPKSDEDFGDAEVNVKKLKMLEDMIRLEKDRALTAAESVRKTLSQFDDASDELRSARLELEKVISNEKEKRKAEIVEAQLATFGIDASLARKTYLPGMQAAIKGKRTVESMETACRIFASTQQAQIVKCCGILDRFAKAHGPEMILDRRELEVSNPDALEAELRRRFEAKKAADEKKRLEDEAAEAKAEADKLKAEAAKADTPPPADKRNPHNLPDPPKIGSIPVGSPKAAPLELHAEETEDEEWSRFMALFRKQLESVKEARAALAHEINQQCGIVIVKALGSGLKEVEAMREGVEA